MSERGAAVGSVGCCGSVSGVASAAGVVAVSWSWLRVLRGLLGRLQGAESLEELVRDWRGGESDPSLFSPSSRRRRCVLVRLEELVCCCVEFADFFGGTGRQPGG